MYDAIIIGARCAGSPLAALLARADLKVLLLDRSAFPSDIMSTHFIHPQGVAMLDAWGVGDAVRESNCPPLDKMTLHFGEQTMVNPFVDPQTGEKGMGICPRRTVLDKILVDAAVAAGAELREHFTFDDLLRDDDGTVTGITGHAQDGRTVTEEARVTIGADGLHSKMARLLDPPEYNRVESVMCAYYSYWSGLEHNGGMEVFIRPGTGAVLFFPTNDKNICVAAGGPYALFDTYRRDPEATYNSLIENVHPELAQRMRSGRREERLLGAGDLPHYFRKPYGPGWALVGDAGLHVDPMNGLGITKAFSEVSMLAPALIDGLSGTRPMEDAMADFHARRDEVWVPLATGNLQASAALSGRAVPKLVPWRETPFAQAEAAAV